MIEGLWKSDNVKINQLNYENGEIKQNEWDLELHIVSQINNQYICRLVFHHIYNKNESGFEFLILNYNKNMNKISGADSNSYLEGYLKDNKIYLISTGFEHIKNLKNKYITSYNTIFTKN